jgi:hypothetical protein
MAKELTYESCFPGRFLSAGHFDGKRITLTVAHAYLEDLDGSEDKPSSKPPKLVMSFVGKKMELVLPKTNAYCLKEMFGNKLADWVGKKVVFYPTKTKFGGKLVDCIRIYGSPDIAEDIELTVPQGKNKPWTTTLHAIKAGTKQEPSPSATVDPTILEAWSALGYSRDAGTADMNAYTGTDYLAHLGALIDQQNGGNA